MFMTESTGSNEHDHALSNFGNNSTAMFGPCWTMTIYDSVISKTEFNWSHLFHLLFSILGNYQGNFGTIFGPCLVSIQFKAVYQYKKWVIFI